MSSTNDFEIENGILKKYTGPGGDVEIPNSVTAIGDRAFRYCSSLKASVPSVGVFSFSMAVISSSAAMALQQASSAS